MKELTFTHNKLTTTDIYQVGADYKDEHFTIEFLIDEKPEVKTIINIQQRRKNIPINELRLIDCVHHQKIDEKNPTKLALMANEIYKEFIAGDCKTLASNESYDFLSRVG